MMINKKIAIIGASYLQKPLVEKAVDMGIYTICFAWDEGAVCKYICDKFYPISVVEKEKILDICIKEEIDGVTSIASDVAVPTMNYIADKMRLTGNSITSSLLCTNKYEMRNAFTQNNIQVPSYEIVTSLNQTCKIKELNFPVIVKPVDRSGSKGVTVVDNERDLKKAVTNAIEQSFVKNAIVEQFVTGSEISVETISWKEKHFILTHTDKVTSGYPHFVELEHHQPSSIINSKNINTINTIVKKGLDALSITNGASHTELIITKDDEVFITEIGARMGGDFIGSTLVELSTGYDFLKGIIEIALGEFSEQKTTCNKYSGVYFYSSKSLKVKEWLGKKDRRIVTSEINNLEILNKPLTQSSDRNGYFIYQDNQKLDIWNK